MSMPAFSMQSPTALKKYQDDGAKNPRTTDTPPPTPWAPGRSRSTRGSAGSRSPSRPTPTTGARSPHRPGRHRGHRRPQGPCRRAGQRRDRRLRPGRARGHQAAEDQGFQIENRDPFNVLYLGMNQKVKPLDDPLVRQAIAYALNKDEIVKRLDARGHRDRDRVRAADRERLHRGRHRSTTTTPRRPTSCSSRPARRERRSSSTTRPASAGPTCRSPRTRST